MNGDELFGRVVRLEFMDGFQFRGNDKSLFRGFLGMFDNPCRGIQKMGTCSCMKKRENDSCISGGLPAMELLESRNVLVIRMDLFPWITWVIMS